MMMVVQCFMIEVVYARFVVYMDGLYGLYGLYVAISGNKIQRNQEDDGLIMINPLSYERTSLCPRNEVIQRHPPWNFL